MTALFCAGKLWLPNMSRRRRFPSHPNIRDRSAGILWSSGHSLSGKKSDFHSTVLVHGKTGTGNKQAGMRLIRRRFAGSKATHQEERLTCIPGTSGCYEGRKPMVGHGSGRKTLRWPDVAPEERPCSSCSCFRRISARSVFLPGLKPTVVKDYPEEGAALSGAGFRL